MVTGFFAFEVSTEPVDGIYTVAFADSSLECYLLLQLDEELNNHYLEYGDQSKSGYGAVDSVLVRSDNARFILDRAVSEMLGTEQLEVRYDLSERGVQSLLAALRIILGASRVQV